jgi:hypothetical protein
VISHKSFEIRWEAFATELLPVLLRALSTGATDELGVFVDENLDDCCDPNEGYPLSVEWRDDLLNGDVHDFADYALTKFYDPAQDFGIGEARYDIERGLAPKARAALLGSPIGPQGNLFDPGRQGSYFQDPSAAASSLKTLAGHRGSSLDPFILLLETAVASGNGVYVTF